MNAEGKPAAVPGEKGGPPVRRLGWFWNCALMLLGSVPAAALNPGLAGSQYIHTTWGPQNGSPLAAIQALAQTRDGYLWLGTDRGLIRFDGENFSEWRGMHGETLPAGGISAIASSAKGGLWASSSAGLLKIDGDRFVNYTAQHQLPAGPMVAILEDHAGTLWLGGVRGAEGVLGRYQDGSIETFDISKRLGGAAITSLFEDGQQRVWVGTSNGICQFAAGDRFDCSLTAPPAEIEAIQRDSAGGLLVLDGRSRDVLRLRGGSWTKLAPALQPVSPLVKSLLVDRDGNIWVGTVGQGLLRIRDGRVERFTKRDGLTSDLVLSLFEDREGNLWVGTGNGLDRFREPKVARISTLHGLSGNLCTAVCPTRDGSIWTGVSGTGVDQVHDNSVASFLPAGKAGSVVLSLHEDGTGRLWAGTSSGLVYRTQGAFVPLPAPDGKQLTRVVAITDDRQGTVWFGDSARGLFRIRNGHLEAETGITLPEGKNVYELFADRSGALWIGYYQGGVSVATAGSQQRFDTGSVAPGPVQVIFQDAAGSIWAGTEEGLSRFRQGRWTTWGAREGLPAGGVHGLAQTGDGQMWAATPSGILKLDAAALERTPDGAPAKLSFATYGPADGVRLTDRRKTVNPRMAKSTDGRLWVTTDDGLAVVDPRYLRANPIAPPVKIERVAVGGKRIEWNGAPPSFLGRDVVIEFAALSLGAPEAVSVRYKLDGLDQNWNEARGTRRIAYGSLRPGNYTFRVIAANEDGLWNNTGASLGFRCQPEFYQTWYFLAACAATLATVLYGLYALRMRILNTRFQLVLDERTRMARELHDTLLQGFAGVVYLLAAAERHFVSSPETSREKLTRAMEQADHSLKEARQALSCMRLAQLEHGSLPEAIQEAGQQIVDGTAIRFEMQVKGTPRQLPYETQADLYIIAREAVNNAMSHAQPAQISVRLEYLPEAVRLAVEDDGIGFNPETDGGKNNHWGLAGMQERAKHIAAKFNLRTRPGAGTTIEVVAPNAADGRGRKRT